MHVLITRPEPDASHWRTLLEARGIKVTVDPMLTIEPGPAAPLDLSGVQALIATSRNALRWLSACPNLGEASNLPLYTVGPGSARAAIALGFCAVREGAGTARELVPLIRQTADPADGALLHLSGDKLAFDLAAALEPWGLRVERRVVYHSRAADRLLETTVAGLSSGAIDTIALLSPLSAETFVGLARAAGMLEHNQRLVYICLSETIARRVREASAAEVIVAAAPNAEAVLEALETLGARRRAC